MTTITINERTKAGKTLLELAKILSISNKGVAIIETGLGKSISKTNEKSPYDPKFVKMVLSSAKSKKRTVINPNNIWGSLGLK